jgi:hypothetical protein
MEQIPGHVLALGAGEKTSIGGERFDEVIVHQSTLGRRRAHVFPTLDLVQPQMCRALPEAEQRQYKTATMGFGNIFTDHLLVYVDLQFSACSAGEMGEAGARAAADGTAAEAAAAAKYAAAAAARVERYAAREAALAKKAAQKAEAFAG